MTTMQIKRFRLNYAQHHDIQWLQQILGRESRLFGSGIELINKGRRLALSVN
jgi:hypothetical protein